MGGGSFAAGQSGPCSLDLGDTAASTCRRGLWVAARAPGCRRMKRYRGEPQRGRHRLGHGGHSQARVCRALTAVAPLGPTGLSLREGASST